MKHKIKFSIIIILLLWQLPLLLAEQKHLNVSVDLNTKAITTIVRFGEGIMDGIKVDQRGNYLISHYEGRIYRVTPDGQFTNLLYVQAKRCADFDYIADKGLLIIPTLEANEIIGYKYEMK